MMETTEFDRLKKEVDAPVGADDKSETKLQRIRQQLSDAVKDGSLQVVDREEVNLVAEFRIWKQSPQVASGIFHFKRKIRHE